MISAPLPPAYPKWRFEPMRTADAAYWLDSYTAWVKGLEPPHACMAAADAEAGGD